MLVVCWGMLAGTALAAELVPPRPLPHKPTGKTLNIAYFREVSSPDGFQATGSFDRMYFYTGNEVLVAIGKDGLYDPAESLAYAYDVLDDGKRYRFYLRQGVQFQGGYGEMTAADVAWSLNRIHRKDTGSRWSNRLPGHGPGRRGGSLHRRCLPQRARRQPDHPHVRPRVDRALAQALGGGRRSRTA